MKLPLKICMRNTFLGLLISGVSKSFKTSRPESLLIGYFLLKDGSSWLSTWIQIMFYTFLCSVALTPGLSWTFRFLEQWTSTNLLTHALAFLVPLSFFHIQDTEIINTAVLTGRTVAIPVKVVSIEINGAVNDVSSFVQCKSFNEDIVKVCHAQVERCSELGCLLLFS